MEIQIHQYGKKFGFELVASNKITVAYSSTSYTRKRNAIAAAKKIAGSKIKVVVE